MSEIQRHGFEYLSRSALFRELDEAGDELKRIRHKQSWQYQKRRQELERRIAALKQEFERRAAEHGS